MADLPRASDADFVDIRPQTWNQLVELVTGLSSTLHGVDSRLRDLRRRVDKSIRARLYDKRFIDFTYNNVEYRIIQYAWKQVLPLSNNLFETTPDSHTSQYTNPQTEQTDHFHFPAINLVEIEKASGKPLGLSIPDDDYQRPVVELSADRAGRNFMWFDRSPQADAGQVVLVHNIAAIEGNPYRWRYTVAVPTGVDTKLGLLIVGPEPQLIEDVYNAWEQINQPGSQVFGLGVPQYASGPFGQNQSTVVPLPIAVGVPVRLFDHNGLLHFTAPNAYDVDCGGKGGP